MNNNGNGNGGSNVKWIDRTLLLAMLAIASWAVTTLVSDRALFQQLQDDNTYELKAISNLTTQIEDNRIRVRSLEYSVYRK